jgi:hypothetical protein
MDTKQIEIITFEAVKRLTAGSLRPVSDADLGIYWVE